ncbi:hypothetical protein ACYULU_01700 [Breznakiellaceae bacterium SP9]
MKKKRFAGVLIALLGLSAMLAGCTTYNQLMREGGGLGIQGLEGFEGKFIWAYGSAINRNFRALQYQTVECALIERDTVYLALYDDVDEDGDGVTMPFEGDAVIPLTIEIRDHPGLDTGTTIAVGTATAKIVGGHDLVTFTLTQGERPSAPAVPETPAAPETPAVPDATAAPAAPQ